MNNINFGRFLVILVNVMISLSSLGAAGDTYTNPGNQTRPPAAVTNPGHRVASP